LEEGKRDRLLTDDEFLLIPYGSLYFRDRRRAEPCKLASGPMIVWLIDLAYMTAQRMGDLRLMTWRDISDDTILFAPRKTKTTTGARVA